jgi:hypothetical protein
LIPSGTTRKAVKLRVVRLRKKASVVTVDQAEATQLVNALIDEAEAVRRDRNLFNAWQRKCRTVLDRVFGDHSSQSKDVMSVRYRFTGVRALGDNRPLIQAFENGIEQAKQVLHSCIWEIERFGMPVAVSSDTHTAFRIVETLCSRFHAVAQQLRHRHEDRPTLGVADEYDVQDLFHALLRLHFDDVRPEEWTPSYAGRSSRMDFLLKRAGMVVEIKKTRKGLDTRRVGEELTIDIARYQSHPDCRMLVCFVYDPENRIVNPAGLENDLSRQSDGLTVKIMICPRA